MKRIWRILIAVLLPVLIIGGAAAAYLALTAQIDVTTKEALSWVSENTFTFELYPGESATAELIVHNSSSADLEVALKTTITPKIKNLTVNVPDAITATALSDTTAIVEVIAEPDVELGTTVITVNFDR